MSDVIEQVRITPANREVHNATKNDEYDSNQIPVMVWFRFSPPSSSKTNTTGSVERSA
jgi:hypothetical protein